MPKSNRNSKDSKSSAGRQVPGAWPGDGSSNTSPANAPPHERSPSLADELYSTTPPRRSTPQVPPRPARSSAIPQQEQPQPAGKVKRKPVPKQSIENLLNPTPTRQPDRKYSIDNLLNPVRDSQHTGPASSSNPIGPTPALKKSTFLSKEEGAALYNRQPQAPQLLNDYNAIVSQLPVLAEQYRHFDDREPNEFTPNEMRANLQILSRQNMNLIARASRWKADASNLFTQGNYPADTDWDHMFETIEFAAKEMVKAATDTVKRAARLPEQREVPRESPEAPSMSPMSDVRPELPLPSREAAATVGNQSGLDLYAAQLKALLGKEQKPTSGGRAGAPSPSPGPYGRRSGSRPRNTSPVDHDDADSDAEMLDEEDILAGIGPNQGMLAGMGHLESNPITRGKYSQPSRAPRLLLPNPYGIQSDLFGSEAEEKAYDAIMGEVASGFSDRSPNEQLPNFRKAFGIGSPTREGGRKTKFMEIFDTGEEDEPEEPEPKTEWMEGFGDVDMKEIEEQKRLMERYAAEAEKRRAGKEEKELEEQKRMMRLYEVQAEQRRGEEKEGEEERLVPKREAPKPPEGNGYEGKGKGRATNCKRQGTVISSRSNILSHFLFNNPIYSSSKMPKPKRTPKQASKSSSSRQPTTPSSTSSRLEKPASLGTTPTKGAAQSKAPQGPQQPVTPSKPETPQRVPEGPSRVPRKVLLPAVEDVLKPESARGSASSRTPGPDPANAPPKSPTPPTNFNTWLSKSGLPESRVRALNRADPYHATFFARNPSNPYPENWRDRPTPESQMPEEYNSLMQRIIKLTVDYCTFDKVAHAAPNAWGICEVDNFHLAPHVKYWYDRAREFNWMGREIDVEEEKRMLRSIREGVERLRIARAEAAGRVDALGRGDEVDERPEREKKSNFHASLVPEVEEESEEEESSDEDEAAQATDPSAGQRAGQSPSESSDEDEDEDGDEREDNDRNTASVKTPREEVLRDIGGAHPEALLRGPAPDIESSPGGVLDPIIVRSPASEPGRPTIARSLESESGPSIVRSPSSEPRPTIVRSPETSEPHSQRDADTGWTGEVQLPDAATLRRTFEQSRKSTQAALDEMISQSRPTPPAPTIPAPFVPAPLSHGMPLYTAGTYGMPLYNMPQYGIPSYGMGPFLTPPGPYGMPFVQGSPQPPPQSPRQPPQERQRRDKGKGRASGSGRERRNDR
ncbi:uncharacterized protein LTR77_005591 [Saxophila tyrrhenica]|uniref:Uncharacterized protein n=1 Tax=Saxophila tyrrhenica TaxID=1690608 RepID=A0AAV9PCE1_9PEZI|nr:hypothetical protein LTR77_005591 [Saxophila tyrrhenica]